MKKLLMILCITLLATSAAYAVFANMAGECPMNYSEETLANIEALLGQDNIPDCSYIREVYHCAFKQRQSKDTVINGKKTTKTWIQEIQFFNVKVDCKKGGNMSCKIVTCDDMWNILKSMPDMIYMKQPTDPHYFDKYLPKE